jgi:hypothetical protein
MKTIPVCICLAIMGVLLGGKPNPVQAQEAGKCNNVSPLYADDQGTILREKKEAGVSITADVYIGNSRSGKNVVVVGQDPDEIGVTIDVGFSSVPGYVLHDEWEMKDRCVPVRSDPGKKNQCADYDPYTGYYYKKVQVPVCHENIATQAIRPVKSVLIWLQPSKKTAEWLNWNPGQSTLRSNLRLIFPDKWMAGTWTPDGFTVDQTADIDASWSESYFEAWKQQLQDYNFLAGDINKISKLWSVYMVELQNPYDNAESLGIFGNFLAGPNAASLVTNSYLREGSYNISYGSEPGGMNEKKENKLENEARSKPRSNEPLYTQLESPEQRESFTITMEHIPIDLPGQWFIGVYVEMSPAIFTANGMQKTEAVDPSWTGDPLGKWFSPEQVDYEMADHYFYAYVLLSTPCNPMEVDGCFDTTMP